MMNHTATERQSYERFNDLDVTNCGLLSKFIECSVQVCWNRWTSCSGGAAPGFECLCCLWLGLSLIAPD